MIAMAIWLNSFIQVLFFLFIERDSITDGANINLNQCNSSGIQRIEPVYTTVFNNNIVPNIPLAWYMTPRGTPIVGSTCML